AKCRAPSDSGLAKRDHSACFASIWALGEICGLAVPPSAIGEAVSSAVFHAARSAKPQAFCPTKCRSGSTATDPAHPSPPSSNQTSANAAIAVEPLLQGEADDEPAHAAQRTQHTPRSRRCNAKHQSSSAGVVTLTAKRWFRGALAWRLVDAWVMGWRLVILI
ncbi:MAG: hypothetical protein EAZ43_16930, partial [Betaproteobacteria bacterium]